MSVYPDPKILCSPKIRLIAFYEAPLPPLEGEGNGDGGEENMRLMPEKNVGLGFIVTNCGGSRRSCVQHDAGIAGWAVD